MLKFFDDYEIQGYVKWEKLYNILPENIDDEGIQESDNEEEEIDSDEEETDDEIEEGEILSEYEA